MRSMINEAKMTKRFNLGEYNFEEYSLGAVVDEKESGTDVLSELKKQINEAFVGDTAPEETKQEKPAKKSKKEEKKNAKSNPVNSKNSGPESDDDENASDDGESDQNDEAPDAEDDENDSDSSDESEGDDSGEEDEKPAKGKPGKEAKEGGKKKFKQKAQAYNRGIEQHKEIFSGVLRSVAPDWKKSDATKALAKKASAAMEGEDFLDEHGEVLPSFRAAVLKQMKGKK